MRIFKIVYQVLGIVLALSLLEGCHCGTKREALQLPNVLISFPPDAARHIPVEIDIEIMFSKPMDKDTTAQAIIIFPEKAHEVFWEDNGRLMMVHPLESWEILTNYEVTITAEARSEDGLYMEEDYTFSFMTGEKLQPPVVMTTWPEDDDELVPSKTSLRINFSKPMDTEATAQAVIISPEIDYEILWEEDGRLMIIRPLESWKDFTKYVVMITSEARSEDGFYMREDYIFFFIVTLPC